MTFIPSDDAPTMLKGVTLERVSLSTILTTLGDNLGEVVISLSTTAEPRGLWPFEKETEGRAAGMGVLGVAGELGTSEIEKTLPLKLDGFFGVSIVRGIVPDA